jgi:K+-transporting ATPase c subunit
MPSTIVVAIPEGEEPSIDSALKMVAKEEQTQQQKKMPPKKESSPDNTTTSAAAADDDVAVVAAAAILSSAKRKLEQTTTCAGGGNMEPLPNEYKKYQKITHHDTTGPVKDEGEKNEMTTSGKQKLNTVLCTAEGCKNEPFMGGVCLVHVAKRLVGNGGREITPVKEDDNDGESNHHHHHGAMSSSSSDDDAAAAAAVAENYEGGKNGEWKDYPLTNIHKPGYNDCLFGRGGGTNGNPGNKKYRKLVDRQKVVYLASKRQDKPLVAMEVVKIWRSMVPPGRFLEQDKETMLWKDVGDEKAREKTSQALREKRPDLKGKKNKVPRENV